MQVAVIIEANPDNAEQVAGVSREPAVVRTAGFASCGLLKSTNANGGITEAVVDDACHHVGHNVCNARIKDLTGLGSEVRDWVS